MTNIIIEDKFCGPTHSGNGGFVCGLIAKYADFEASVILRKPPPLSKPLMINSTEMKVQLFDGDEIIGEAQPHTLELTIPEMVPFEDALEASKKYAGFSDHEFPNCFVCGPNRMEGDGLRIFAGPVRDKKIAAAPWIPHPSLTDGSTSIKEEFIWSALDCPGYFSFQDLPARRVLGKMSANIVHPIDAGEKCVVLGWPILQEGRKHSCGTAIFKESGKLIAYSHSLWIDL